MQESSKGKYLLPTNNNSVEQEMQNPHSAFQFVGKDGKSCRPNSGSQRTEKRDSGYATDNSPANFGNNHQLLFTFDIEQMEKRSGGNSDEILDDKIDEEVEMVLSHQRNVVSVSEPISIPGTIQRPTAPVPRADGDELHKSTSLPTFHYRNRHRHYFRPIESRSVGTQTPSPHSQIISEAISDRFHPYLPNAARVHARLRHYSEGEDLQPARSPLPDLVQEHRPRDRSVSLPNVPSLQLQNEMAVGRELRRISDEFHFSYIPRSRRGSFINGYHQQPASFPRTSAFNFQNWWENLRLIFSSQSDIRDSSIQGSPLDFDVFEDEH